MGKLQRAHTRLLRKQAKKTTRKKVRRIALHAGTAAFFTLSGNTLLHQKVFADEIPDPHFLEITADIDADGLADWEERVLVFERHIN